MKIKSSIAAILIFFILSLQNAFAQVSFSAATNFTNGGNNLFGIVCADFNGDGKIDYACGSISSTSVSVFINTTATGASTPTFSGPTSITTLNTIYRITSADFNGDGKPDLAIGNNAAGVNVLFNTTTTGAATPTFSAAVNFATGNGSYGITTADINGDGKIDIINACFSANKVFVLLNTTATGGSTPSFAAGVSFTTSTAPLDVRCGDINLDGKPDIVTPNQTGTVSIFLNTTVTGAATPTFSAKTDITTTGSAYALALADINLDGKADIIAGNYNSNKISINLNTTSAGASTPTFSTFTEFTTLSGVNFICTADINYDGKPDIIGGGGTSVFVFMDTTAPGASTPVLYTRYDISSVDVEDGCAVDFNGDGKLDIVKCGSTNNISIFMNTMTIGTSTPTFSSTTTFPVVTAPSGIVCPDFNLDGIPDLACSNYQSAVASVLLGTTSIGTSTPTFSSVTTLTTGANPLGGCTADFNLDGKPDLAYSHNGAFFCSVFLNTTTVGAATPTFATRKDLTASQKTIHIESADFNLDGKPDLLTSHQTGEWVSVYLNTTTPGAGTATFSSENFFATASESYWASAVDLNGDGKPDIVAVNSFSTTLSVFINTTSPGASTPTFTAKTDFTVGASPQFGTLADINGDGKQDIVCINTGPNTISVMLNATTPGSTTPSFGIKTDFTVTGFTANTLSKKDLDGDGKIDLLVNNRLYKNTTTPGSSTPSFSVQPAYGFSTNSTNFSDFNRDGISDVAFASGNNLGIVLGKTSVPLPVELSSFVSIVKGNDVTLNWSTAQEVNNKGFEIERNSFDEGWKKIGYIEGNGTTNTQQSYSFTERGLTTGSYHYRLKQIDYNGNFEYHELTSEVIIGVPAKYSLAQNYPNPFNPSTIINYQLSINSFVTLKVYDISGREVKTLVNEVKDAGYYSVQFDAKNLSSGTYFYKITTDKFSDVKKMIVVK